MVDNYKCIGCGRCAYACKLENHVPFEWSLGALASDRDTIIKEIKDYMEKNEITKNCI